MTVTKTRLFSPWESEAWLPPPEETIDEWAERNLRLPRGVSSLSGPLSLELTPYLREPLRAVTDPETEEVVLCTSTQVAKTTMLVIVAAYYLAVDPWNIFFVLPTDEQAAELNHERFQPIILETPALNRFVSKRQGEFKTNTIRLNGATISFRGAHSPSGLSSKPAKIAIADEVDKWPEWTGKEASPLDLLGERTKTFHDSKFLKCSTPTTSHGYIWRELADSTNERYHVPCPLCGAFQVLVFGDGTENQRGIKWPHEATPDEIEHENLAWYECARCRGRIAEGSKRQMVCAGVWAPRTAEIVGGKAPELHDRRKRGFHLWSAYTLWPKAGWSKIAARFLKAKGRPAALMNFRNSWQGEVWEVTVNELKDGHLRRRQANYWKGAIPDESIAVTIGVDVQATGEHTYQYYVVRAWGPGGVSWMVSHGLANGWRDVYTLVHETDYRTSSGKPVTVIRPLVDSGYRTLEVYGVCQRNGWIATKGDARTRRGLSHQEIPVAPESDELIEYVAFNPDTYKTALHRLVRQDDKWHLPQGVDEEYFAHMIAEQQQWTTDKQTGRRKVVWRLSSEGLPNHYFDCEVLNLVAADLAQLGNRKEQEDLQTPEGPENPPKPPAAESQPQRRENQLVRVFT